MPRDRSSIHAAFRERCQAPVKEDIQKPQARLGDLVRLGFKEGDFPVTEFAGRTSIAIRFHNLLTAEEIDYVADVLERALGEVQ
ncbi:MAG: hypothetical protein QME82_09795 [Bacillota bacterium]|nr:hypothetical protein [Bacillota bacterium]